jgi:hypothetical protein
MQRMETTVSSSELIHPPPPLRFLVATLMFQLIQLGGVQTFVNRGLKQISNFTLVNKIGVVNIWKVGLFQSTLRGCSTT